MSLQANSPTQGRASPPDEMRVEQATTWFVRLRGDTVSEQDRAQFALWLDASPAHRRTYEEIAALWNDPALTRALGETPLTTVTSRPVPRRWSRTRAAWGLALAAGLALVAVLDRSALPRCLGADYCTGTGEVRRITLADGSSATLNTDSALELAFGQGLRQVRLLSGEALFEVLPDPQHPFVVYGPHSQTRVKGTRFVVREERTADTVTVLSGVVEVGQAGQFTAVLNANDQIHLGQGTGGEIGRVTGAVAAAWTHGGVLFDGIPLEQVVKEIGRYRKGMVIVTNERLKSLKVSGRFDIRDTDRALVSLEQTLPIKIRRITPWIVVIS